MRRKFKVYYPINYHDKGKAGKQYKPKGMLCMNSDGVFMEMVNRGWDGWSVYKLSDILLSYDIVWEE